MAELIKRDGRTGVWLTDYRDLRNTMRSIDPTLVSAMRKDFRKVAKPMQRDIKRGIPMNPPTSGIHVKRPQNTISGFTPITVPGRLTWGANYQNRNRKVDHVITRMPRVKRKFANGASVSSIARVEVDNAAVVMADLAGSSRKYINKRPMTREYDYSRSKTGVRKHRINNQGIGMIRALDKKGRPSRFVYPAALRALPGVRAEAVAVLARAYNQINQELRTK